MVRVTVMVAQRLLRYHVLLLPTVQTYSHTRIRFVHQTSKTCTCTTSSDILGQVSSRCILSNLFSEPECPQLVKYESMGL